MARILFLILCSQYPCAMLTMHRSSYNSVGLCSFPTCRDNAIVESSEHVLLHCPAYNRTRQNMYSLCFKLPNKISLTLIANIMFKHSSMFKHATPSRLLSYPRSNWELPVSWWSSLFWPLIFQQNLVLQSKLRKQVEFAVRHPLPPGVKSHRFPSKNFLIIHQDGTYHQIKSSN